MTIRMSVRRYLSVKTRAVWKPVHRLALRCGGHGVVFNAEGYFRTDRHRLVCGSFSVFLFFFLSGFSFTDTDNSQDSRGREGTIFYYTLPLRPAHQHSDIDLQLCMQDDYHIFLIAPLDFTRLLLDEIYHLYRVGGVQLLSSP